MLSFRKIRKAEVLVARLFLKVRVEGRMLKLKTRFSQVFSVSNFISTAHSVFHKIGSSRATDTILGLK